MKRSTWYKLWILALALKMIGSSWDVSYHFKYLRDLTQLPHIVNAMGFALAIMLWIFAWRTEKAEDKGPLKVIAIGFGIFFAAIPVDDWWHRTYGLDLTTWSPPHFSLYTGTVITILGLLMSVSYDAERGLITNKARKIYHQLVFLFLFEAFWFPLVQQEQGVLAYNAFMNGTSIASEEILVFLQDPKSQIYGGIPDWLYGVYGAFVIMMIFRLAKSFDVNKFSSTYLVGLYLVFRVIMDLIFGASEYQQSTVPYYLVGAALLYDLGHHALTKRSITAVRITLQSIFVVGSIYALSFVTVENPIIPPLPVWSLAAATLTALIGYAVATELYRRALSGYGSNKLLVPSFSRSIGQ